MVRIMELIGKDIKGYKYNPSSEIFLNKINSKIDLKDKIIGELKTQ